MKLKEYREKCGYRLLSHDDINDLEREVTYFMLFGWNPVGSIVIKVIQDKLMYYQPVKRYSKSQLAEQNDSAIATDNSTMLQLLWRLRECEYVENPELNERYPQLIKLIKGLIAQLPQ